ncbi:MAG: endonuclease/exonuclease/phosphatase family protein [Alteripontixanthobacter sp.]
MAKLTVLGKILLALAALLLLLTLISLVPSNRGFIRMLDFVREPAIFLSAGLIVAALFFARPRRLLVIGVLALAIAINLFRLWPYSFLAPTQIALPDDVDGMSCMRVLSLNVLQPNDQYGRVARLIESQAPDTLLLMETDAKWIAALEPQLSAFGYRLEEPLDNKYGMAFATNLQVDRAEMVSNTNANTPTLYATMRTDDGARFEMIGLHPRPPLPGESTESRDANIARAGARTPDDLGNVLAIGDFNDVPWSRTTQRFVAEGGYLDPRIGRGTFATFPADYAAIGWPLDQLFVRDGVRIESFKVLDDVGSDHRALAADVCVQPRGTQPSAPALLDTDS